MLVGSLITAVHLAAWILSVLLIVDILVSYFLNPFHPIRRTLDSIIQPLLQPIRRVVPNVGMLDLSPIVLLILIRIVEELLVSILISVI